MLRRRVGALVVPMLAIGLPVEAQDTREVTVGAEYEVSGTVEQWFGPGYRDVWTTPVVLPVIDLDVEGGGLEPVRQVGGMQTAGLALAGADGRSYTFRSLHKEPERLLPEQWHASWPARLIRDATSATHPGAGVVLSALAEAAGLPSTRTRLVVMPDDPRLGEFRPTFANVAGTLDEYPTAASESFAGFEGAAEILPTVDLWVRWLEGTGAVDSRAFLRARILDLYVSNYDRRRNQWRWMRIPGRDEWLPLPEDPDMAFVRHNGLIVTGSRQFQPQMLEFTEAFPASLEGLTAKASEVDRWLLSDLDRDAFVAVAEELREAWTDAVIADAVSRLPPEWQAVDDGFLVSALRSRRDALVPFVERFYRWLASDVDVQLTDRPEVVSIMTAADGATTVTATVAGEPSPSFARTFQPAETDEVRVYLHGGDDRVVREDRGSIRVRVIAGDGATTVESPDRRTEVWAGAGPVSGGRVSRHAPWTNPAPVEGAPWIEPRSSGHVTTWMPTFSFSPSIGVVAGASVTTTNFGFRASPYASRHIVGGGWAFGERNGRFEYDGTFLRPDARATYGISAFASGIERPHYFGFGNQTDDLPSSEYRSPRTTIAVALTATVGAPPGIALTVGPEIRYDRSGGEPGTRLHEEAPYGTGPFGSVRVRATLEVDTRNVVSVGLLAAARGGHSGVTTPELPGSGVRVAVSAYAAPAVWDVEDVYGGVEGLVAGYVGNSSVQLAARLGGSRVEGTYPWFDAAWIGGKTNRGYPSHRFVGDRAVYGSLELRAYLGQPRFQAIFPVRFGLVGFVDAGRVWLDGEASDKWHPSAGGGALLKPVGTSITLRAMVAHSTEGILFYAGSGFGF